MVASPVAETTYEEYRRLRREIGYLDELAMDQSVWEGCTPESQENMLAQFRPYAAQAVAFEKIHGVPWG